MPNFKHIRQCYVITACCCLHNFICINNRSDELFNIWDNVEYEGNMFFCLVVATTKLPLARQTRGMLWRCQKHQRDVWPTLGMASPMLCGLIMLPVSIDFAHELCCKCLHFDIYRLGSIG